MICVCQCCPGGTTTRHVSEPGSTIGSPDAVTVTPRNRSDRSCSTSSLFATSISAPPRDTLPSFTANRSAKSASTCTSTDTTVASWLRFSTVMVSRSHSATNRSRTTRRVLSARSTRGARRWMNRAAKASEQSTDNGSGSWPSTRSSHRDSTRASRKKKPCGRPKTMSPWRSDRQNVAPSTSVTVSAHAPLCTAGWPLLKAEGSRPRGPENRAALRTFGTRSMLPIRHHLRRTSVKTHRCHSPNQTIWNPLGTMLRKRRGGDASATTRFIGHRDNDGVSPPGTR